MSDNLRESLSALMDNEATELEFRRILRQAKDDPDLLDDWRRYHLVRDVMHQQADAPAPEGLLAGIREAISEEPLMTGEAAEGESGMPWLLAGFGRALGQGAIAASVALVVLFTAHSLKQPDQTGTSAPLVAGGGVGSNGAGPSGVTDITNESSGSAQLTAFSASNDYVETPLNRNVSFQADGEEGLDPQSRDRLRRAIYREFGQNTQVPRIPVFYIEQLPE